MPPPLVGGSISHVTRLVQRPPLRRLVGDRAQVVQLRRGDRPSPRRGSRTGGRRRASGSPRDLPTSAPKRHWSAWKCRCSGAGAPLVVARPGAAVIGLLVSPEELAHLMPEGSSNSSAAEHRLGLRQPRQRGHGYCTEKLGALRGLDDVDLAVASTITAVTASGSSPATARHASQLLARNAGPASRSKTDVARLPGGSCPPRRSLSPQREFCVGAPQVFVARGDVSAWTGKCLPSRGHIQSPGHFLSSVVAGNRSTALLVVE